MLCEDSFSSDSNISEDEAKVDIQIGQILNLYWDIANGQGSIITRQVNIAQTLGSVTVGVVMVTTVEGSHGLCFKDK